MPRTSHRKIALLLTSTLAVAITAMTMIPAFGRAQEATPAAVSQAQESELLARGEEIYTNTCIACHQAGGTGAESDVAFTYYPPLAGNPFVTLEDPVPVVNTVLFGRAGMPSFRGMSDEEIASVITYTRQSWSNDASAVSPELVAEVRAEVNIPPQPPATPFPSPPLDEGTPDVDIRGTPPGIQEPEAPRGTAVPIADAGNGD